MSFGNWLGLAGVVAALLLLWSLREALVLLFAAVVLAMALCTLVGTVQRRLGCGRRLALAGVGQGRPQVLLFDLSPLLEPDLPPGQSVRGSTGDTGRP